MIRKSTQGDIRTIALSGAESVMGMTGISLEGWGWLRWDIRDRTRLPPAESPAMTMFAGDLCMTLRTCVSRLAACCSCRGYFTAGARS